MTKIPDSQNRKLIFGWPFCIKNSALRARPLSSHRNMGGRFGVNWRFFKRKIDIGLPFFMTYTNCGGYVDENGYFAYVKRILRWTAGGDVEKIGHFQKRKSRSQGSIFFASLLGGDVEK